MIEPGQLRRWTRAEIVIEYGHDVFLVMHRDENFVSYSFWHTLTPGGVKVWSESRIQDCSEVVSEAG